MLGNASRPLLLALLAIVPALTAEASDELPVDLLSIEMALFFVGEPSTDPLAQLAAIGKRPEYGIRVLDLDKDPLEPLPAVQAEWVALMNYMPPSEKSWRFSTRDLDISLCEPLAQGKRVLVMHFLVAKNLAVEHNFRISSVIADLADATGGLPWDEETRLLFSAAVWRETRVDSWHEGLPDLAKHFVIHSYRQGEMVRLVTLGLRKFSIPDLVIKEAANQSSRTLGLMINACAQAQIEGNKPADGQMKIDFAAVRHPEVRKTLQANPQPGASGQATLSLSPTQSEEGDADNDLLELDFVIAGDSAQERHQAGVHALFGSTDAIIWAHRREDDEELQAASEKARKLLQELRPSFVSGLAPGEYISVKAPFTSQAGEIEWMWLEVTRWDQTELTGLLTNEPFLVKHLKPGSQVTVAESEVFDFIHHKADGTVEGNETGAILERQEKNRGK